MERTPRAKLERAGVDGGVAEVMLTFKGRSETGRAECRGDAGGLLATAEATIEAARALAASRFSCVVRLAEVAELCGTEFALVNATLYAGGRVVPVLGSCATRGDATAAVARATLDAVNRWLDLSLDGYGLERFDELPFERPGGEGL